MPGMRAGTIKTLLRRKVKEWLKSVPDEAMRQCFADNIVVTGGAIPSYLLGERPHDFDFYFKTYESTLTAAIYYAQTFNSSNPGAGIKVKEERIANCKGIEESRILFFIQSAGLASETQDTYKYFEMQPVEETHEFAASLTTRDSPTEEGIRDLVEDPAGIIEALDNELKGKDKLPYRPVFLTDNAVSLANNVQLITRFYGSPGEIHDNFDFIHAMCYYDYKNDVLSLPQEALLAILTKTLVYRGSLYPLASIFRIRKFIKRGWRISAGQMLKIMWQINKIDLSTPAALREQLLGVDQAYMQQILNDLSELKPHEKIDGAYLMAIIDKVFDE